MPEQARSVLIVYDHFTKTVKKWIVPDFEHQVIDPQHLQAWVDWTKGEASLKVPISVYRSWLNGLPDIQAYVSGNAP